MTPQPPPERLLNGVVEVDETYSGAKLRTRSRATRTRALASGKAKSFKTKRRKGNKVPVLAMLERGGEVRAMVCPTVTAANVRDILLDKVSFNARLMTDESTIYVKTGQPFAGHQAVKHSLWEYAGGEAHTNGVESFFSRRSGSSTGPTMRSARSTCTATSPRSPSSTTPATWRTGSGRSRRLRVRRGSDSIGRLRDSILRPNSGRRVI